MIFKWSGGTQLIVEPSEGENRDAGFRFRTYALTTSRFKLPQFRTEQFGRAVTVPEANCFEACTVVHSVLQQPRKRIAKIKLKRLFRKGQSMLKVVEGTSNIDLSRMYVLDSGGNRLLLGTGPISAGSCWYVSGSCRVAFDETCSDVASIEID